MKKQKRTYNYFGRYFTVSDSLFYIEYSGKFISIFHNAIQFWSDNWHVVNKSQRTMREDV